MFNLNTTQIFRIVWRIVTSSFIRVTILNIVRNGDNSTYPMFVSRSHPLTPLNVSHRCWSLWLVKSPCFQRPATPCDPSVSGVMRKSLCTALSEAPRLRRSLRRDSRSVALLCLRYVHFFDVFPLLSAKYYLYSIDKLTYISKPLLTVQWLFSTGSWIRIEKRKLLSHRKLRLRYPRTYWFGNQVRPKRRYFRSWFLRGSLQTW